MRSIVLVLGLAGCAWQTAPMDLGGGMYETSANASPARGATTGAREMALTSARELCRSMGKSVEVKDVRTGYAFPANGTAVVTFRCA